MTDKELVQAAKDYFAQIRKTNRLIHRLKETASTLRSTLTSQNYELKQDIVQTSGPMNTLEDTMIKVIELENSINARIDEVVAMKQDAFNRISGVPDLDQQNVLIGRYIQLKKWEELALEFEWSTQWLFEIHGKALLEFARVHTEFLLNREKQSLTGCK